MAENERIYRRWSSFTPADIQLMADSTPREEYMHGVWGDGPYMAPYNTDLIGKRFEVEDNEGFKIAFEQTEQRWIKWEIDGVEHTDPCSVHSITEGVYFINHYCEGSTPPESHQFVIDIQNGLCTVCVAKFDSPYNAREVRHTFHFGFITNQGYTDPGYRHGFTEDMVGKSIVWEYHSDRMFPKHIYVSPTYYTIVGQLGGAWCASNPADYVKIRDGVYIFSFLEDRQAGAQGFFLMDLYQLHDVGCFFGMEPTGLTCYTIGAKGQWSETYSLSTGGKRETVFDWEK